MTLGNVDLSHLTNDEKERILKVLERDDELRDSEQKRIRSLKDEVKSLRLKGTIREGGGGGGARRCCARCRQSFGLVFNTGATCPRCQHRVCQKCRESIVPGKWLCVFCFRQMEFEAKSGNWFYSKFPRTMRDKSTNEVIPGGKVIRGAISVADSAGKSLKAVSAYQMKQPQPPKPVDAAASLLPGVSALTPPRQQQQQRAAGSIVPTATQSPASTSSPQRQSIPEISVTKSSDRHVDATSRKILEDGRSLRSLEEEEDFPDSQKWGMTSPTPSTSTNLSRLSAMTGSTESVLSFYSCAGEANIGKIAVTGDVQFGISYVARTSSLEVTIRGCRDLAAVDTKRNRSDPYVKCYLLPDRSRNGKRKTHCKKNTLNPVFNEVIKYSVSRGEIESRTLCVMVWNYDRFGRNDFLGEVNVPLTSEVVDDTALKWYKLENRVANPLSTLAYKGDLDISLKYDNAKRVGGKVVATGDLGELQVLVKQARNLTALRSGDTSDPFCQACLLPARSKRDKQKTGVVKNSCNPVWNHTFIFENLAADELRQSSVELTIWDHDRLTSHEFLGGVRLNLGTGRRGGTEVDWMDGRGDEVMLWQAMMDRPNAWIDGTLLLRVYMVPRK